MIFLSFLFASLIVLPVASSKVSKSHCLWKGGVRHESGKNRGCQLKRSHFFDDHEGKIKKKTKHGGGRESIEKVLR